MRTLYTVILKPTKACNADCSYCAAPTENKYRWDIATFRKVFDFLEPAVHDGASIIWHGGEPMLLGTEFYRQAHDYVISKRPSVKFSMQSNILLYTEKWRDVFANIFKGSISTSYEPGFGRTLGGNATAYTKVFFEKIVRMIEDGFFPMVIGTYQDHNINMAIDMYDWSLNMQEKYGHGCHIRINYCTPTGRAKSGEWKLNPERYGEVLVDIFDRWVDDCPSFDIVPLSQMLDKCLGTDTFRCPWINDCGGRFIEVEPNGDMYNCGEFADIGDRSLSFGNVFQDGLTIFDALHSRTAKKIKRRPVSIPEDCLECEHYRECQGGCSRDAWLNNGDISGKFPYCKSWKAVFGHMKTRLKNQDDRMKFFLDARSRKRFIPIRVAA